MIDDTIPAFSAMLKGALGDRLAPGADSFVEMFDEEGVMEFPFAPADGVRRIDGRQALIDYLGQLGTIVRIDSVSAPVIHRPADPDTVILEFESTGASVATGREYRQTYISVIALSGGRIVRYRDYWNPLVVIGLAGDGEPRAAAAAEGSADGC